MKFEQTHLYKEWAFLEKKIKGGRRMCIISKMNSHHISGLNQFVHLQKEKQRKERKEKKKI